MLFSLSSDITASSFFLFNYTSSPDEYPFFPRDQLSKPILPPLNYPKLLHPNNVNVNDKIKQFYINKIIPGITKQQDDGNYGSVACRDIEALQAISRRIHYGGCLVLVGRMSYH